MKERQPRNVGASVRDRLQKLARAKREDFQLLLTRYANERLLFRLSASNHANRFVLKGAALFTVWTGTMHRATRDLDLLGFVTPDAAQLREILADVLDLDVPDDGVRFDLGTLSVAPIREEQRYGGMRAEVVAQLASARVRLQVDVGFGDAITPEPTSVEYPALLDYPAPRLRAYPRETVVAEKLEAMVQLGLANSRMKDFYDIAMLARSFEFDSDTLARAIRATFERRTTPLPTTTPVALSSTFAEDRAKRAQWSGFVRKTGARDAGSLGEAVAAVRSFVEVPLAVAAGTTPSTSLRWRGDGWV